MPVSCSMCTCATLNNRARLLLWGAASVYNCTYIVRCMFPHEANEPNWNITWQSDHKLFQVIRPFVKKKRVRKRLWTVHVRSKTLGKPKKAPGDTVQGVLKDHNRICGPMDFQIATRSIVGCIVKVHQAGRCLNKILTLSLQRGCRYTSCVS